MEALQRAACVVLVRPSPQQRQSSLNQGDASGPATWEYFLARRSERLVFLGGFYAFVGGKVEPADSHVPVRNCPSLVAEDFCVAALRELFEETGILAVPHAASVTPPALQTGRRGLLSAALGWGAWLEQNSLHLDAAPLLPVGRWQTPPFLGASFDAQYFALRLPAGCAPNIWPGELTHGLWLTAAEALRRHESAELFLTYPTLHTLKMMDAAGGDWQAAGAAARQAVPSQQRGGGELMHGVHCMPLRTPTLPPATHTNCYVLGLRDLVVVDPGPEDVGEQQRLTDYLHSLCSQGARLQEVWLTHHHHDHWGAAALLRQRYGVPVAAHPDAAHRLQPFPIDRLLHDNEEVALGDGVWRALLTPGHAPGHLCFYHTQRRHLLSGDTILGAGTSLVAPAPEGNMTSYMASLKRLLSLPMGMLLPGHGPPVAAAADKIQEYLAHRLAREQAIVDVLRQHHEPVNVALLVRQIYVELKPEAYPLAAMNVQSHLEKLCADGLVTCVAPVHADQQATYRETGRGL